MEHPRAHRRSWYRIGRFNEAPSNPHPLHARDIGTYVVAANSVPQRCRFLTNRRTRVISTRMPKGIDERAEREHATIVVNITLKCAYKILLFNTKQNNYHHPLGTSLLYAAEK